MSAVPIRKTSGQEQFPVKIFRTVKRKKTSTISAEIEAQAHFPDNPRAQELDIKIRKGEKLTDEERAEFSRILVMDEDRLLDIVCRKMLGENY